MLDVPTQIGAYGIDREIGRGGMGVVYHGVDTRLGREVAVKALPLEVAGDPDRMARFEREAKVLATVSHPNVAGIYGVEEAEGQRYLVLEYVEGETLADRLERGALPVDEAIEVCVQIAAGVEAAHESGIVHRDLKPHNVKITPDGVVKVLDFGLAKTEAGAETSMGTASLTMPTTPQSPTVAGAILGTAPYMSPEQARGRRIDKRTDVWSFGVVLYECLAGIGPFVGETATDSIGAILHKEIDLNLLPSETPGRVYRVLRRCLERDRSRRLRDIGDARLELEASEEDGEVVSAAAARRFGVVGFAVAGVAVAAAGLMGWFLRPVPAPEAEPVRRLSVSLPTDFVIPGWVGPVLSPDGRRIVTMAEVESEDVVMLREIDQLEFRSMGSGWAPFFSPDGEWLAYFDDDQTLVKRSIRGGPSIALCETDQPRGGAWGEDGRIVLARGRTGGLSVMPAAGGQVEDLTVGDKRGSHRWPVFLPESRGVLFTSAPDNADWDEARVMVVEFGGGEPRVVVEGGAHGVYVETGHVVYQREKSLLAVPFDLDRLEVTGAPMPVLDGVTTLFAPGAPPQFSIDRYGSVLYMTGDRLGQREVVRIGLDGTRTALSSRQAEFREVVPSPDGRFVCVSLFEQASTVLGILEVERDILRMLPMDGESDDSDPVWSPDGRWIVFSSEPKGEGARNLFRIRSDLTGGRERLTTSDAHQYAGGFTSDGRVLAMSQGVEDGQDIYLLRFDESGGVVGEPEPFVESPSWQWSSRISADDRWVSYSSAESGTQEVYVKPLAGDGPVVQVSTNGARHSAWSTKAGEMFLFTDSPLSIWRVSYEVEGDRFMPGLPELAVRLEGASLSAMVYPLSDGSGFLTSLARESEGGLRAREPTLVVNWLDELRDRVGVASGGR